MTTRPTAACGPRHACSSYPLRKSPVCWPHESANWHLDPRRAVHAGSCQSARSRPRTRCGFPSVHITVYRDGELIWELEPGQTLWCTAAAQCAERRSVAKCCRCNTCNKPRRVLWGSRRPISPTAPAVAYATARRGRAQCREVLQVQHLQRAKKDSSSGVKGAEGAEHGEGTSCVAKRRGILERRWRDELFGLNSRDNCL